MSRYLVIVVEILLIVVIAFAIVRTQPRSQVQVKPPPGMLGPITHR